MDLNSVVVSQIHGDERHVNVNRWIFIPAAGGVTVGGSMSVYADWAVCALPPNIDTEVYCSFRVPSDFVSVYSWGAIVMASISGNIMTNARTTYAAEGEYRSEHVADTGDVEQSIPLPDRLFNVPAMVPGAFDPMTRDDFCTIRFARIGSSEQDDLLGDLLVIGFLFEYTANQ